MVLGRYWGAWDNLASQVLDNLTLWITFILHLLVFSWLTLGLPTGRNSISLCFFNGLFPVFHVLFCIIVHIDFIGTKLQ